MPAVNLNIMIKELTSAIACSGGFPAYISESRAQPRKFLITHEGNTYSLWVYIWTLTHGGRANLKKEYRIQMTSVTSPLELNPNGLTVLMGYYPDLQMFAGLDLHKHRTFSTGSPSVQISLTAIQEALQHGLSFITKDNGEIAIGVRPDQFLNYCINAELLHLCGSENNLPEILTKAVELQEIPQQDIAALAAERKRVVENISRYSRSANFSKKILNAYDHRCAITRAQLRLIDAAHILPVCSDKSNDHVSNGIALSPTFHRAYDNCLIYFDENYFVRLNKEKAEELKANNLSHGLTEFCRLMDEKIYLPADRKQWPDVDYIRLANKYRRIPSYF